MTHRKRHAPPKASAMLEALRGLGYSTVSALADIIDNSISAKATEVHLQLDWVGEESRITILDNGRGMDDAQLEAAMTLGTINPLEKRDMSDLGRFGMGLKTASFSQCRRLTVASKCKGGQVVCLRWDLDAISTYLESGWYMLEGPSPGSENILERLSHIESGTVVLWELMDRVVTQETDLNHFLDLIDDIELRLGMIFHRLIEGAHPDFSLFINKKRVMPWDPFMTGHPAKALESPVERKITSSGIVSVQCHVLPHKDKLSEVEFQKAAGPEGWTSQQGFYVYRNKRLLLAGSWLGLGKGRAWIREEPHKLARIRIDIPNTADSDWKIDVKKSTARPPVYLRNWLTRLAENTRSKARSVFAFRGTPATKVNGLPVEQAWRVDHSKGGVRYRIDLSHPAVSSVIEACPDKKDIIWAMLRILEETVPVQRIWLDTAENKETPMVGFEGDEESSPEGVKVVLTTLYNDMVRRRGMSPESAIKLLATTEPFQNYPKLVSELSVSGI